jgi:ERF superfamily
MNIYQKLNAVQKAVAYVRKDAEVKGAGSYKAVSHDMVTAIVRPHFVEHGVVVVPRLVSSQMVDTGRKTSAGNPIMRFEGSYEVSFVNMDDAADVLTMPVAAHAEDQGDKAPGKALSYATKGAILKVLLLESGDADESRVGPAEVELTDEQTAILVTLRGRALEGTAALQKAWSDLGKTYRIPLANELASLKAAAITADKEARHAA